MSKKTGRKQFFLNQIEIDLITTSLEFLDEESTTKQVIYAAHGKCRGFTKRRIAELLERFQPMKEKS